MAFAEDFGLLLLGPAVLGTVLLVFALVRTQGLRRALRQAETERDRALAADDAANRTLRMAGAELRGSALALLGHADRIRTDGGQSAGQAAAINVVSAQIFALADDLQDHAVPSAESRVLHVEPMRLDEPVREALASVSATLGPSRRHWSIDPDLAGVSVLADRRALMQVFLRVLTNAARFTRHEDRIAVSLLARAEGVTVVVADAATIEDAEAGMRGVIGAADPGAVGLGLAMARVLMQAHGGELAVAAVPRFGTCVTLTLPAQRVKSVQPQTV